MKTSAKAAGRRGVAAALLGAGLAGAAGMLSLRWSKSAQGRAASLVSGSGASVPSAGAPESRRESIRRQHLPNIELLAQDGRRVRFYDDLVKGRVVAINFMYTLCEAACPVSTANLARVQKSLAGNGEPPVTFLSISLKPEFDTPDHLQAYAEAHGIGANWYFLTGRRDDIETLRRSLGAYELDPEVDQDPKQHTGLVILGNEPAGRWKSIPSLIDPARIAQAIDRIRLPVTQWPTGDAVVNAVPYEESAASTRLVEAAGITVAGATAGN